jgi:hypothetical protein
MEGVESKSSTIFGMEGTSDPVTKTGGNENC